MARDQEMDDLEDEGLPSSDSDDDDGKAERMIEILHLQEMVSREPYNYEAHVNLIKMLSEGDDLDKLRASRENMAKFFPLTPKLWLDWIKNEINVCLDDEEKLKVVDLFKRAVEDYTSVELWLEYCQFGIGLMNSESFGVEEVRATFERACNRVGLHAQKGSLIFEAYREFELIYQGLIVAKKEPDAETKLQEQRDRIMTLFRRHLSIPHLNMENTLHELKQFSEEIPDENLMRGYEKAYKHLQKILPFETALQKIEEPKYPDYEDYLVFEMQEGDPARIQMLFERAIHDDCLDSRLWDRYLKYMDLTLKIDSLALPVHERSIRNCPWSSSLWVSYLICMEKLNTPLSKIETVVEEAFNVGLSTANDYFNIWIAYISYIRRKIDFSNPDEKMVEKIRKCFDKAQEHILEMDDGGYFERILEFWANFEAKVNNVPRARELWAIIMKRCSTNSEKWLVNAAFERIFGDAKHLRKILQRALNSVVDNLENIAEYWLQYERQEGTLEAYLDIQAKFEQRLVVVNEIRKKQIEELKIANYYYERDNPSILKVKKRKANKSPDKTIQEKKGKWSDLDKDGFKVPFSKDEPAHIIPVEKDPLTEAQTVFLSNLAYEVEKEKILDIFKDVGEIDELRLVTDYKNRCKGFGYLIFKNMSSVGEALKKDRTQIDGRPMFVSKCNERKQFSFKVGMEKNKLFVKNIPFDSSKEEIEELFKQCGQISDVRLCQLRNGKFKGMAYVDFVEESAASAAVVKFDGFEMRDKQLSVSISNPPARTEKKSTVPPPTYRRTESTMKARLFIPRSLQIKTPPAEAAASATVPPAGPSRSNDDFRNMFLNKE